VFEMCHRGSSLTDYEDRYTQFYSAYVFQVFSDVFHMCFSHRDLDYDSYHTIVVLGFMTRTIVLAAL